MLETAPAVRARQLIQAGALAEAERAVRQAVATQPSSAAAVTLAGQIAIRRSSVRDAVRYFTRAAFIDGTGDSRTLLNLARAQALAGLSQESLETVSRAVARFPREPAPRGLLALLLTESGDIDAAASSLSSIQDAELDGAMAYKIGVRLKDHPRHRELAAALLVRSANEPGRYAASALPAALALLAVGNQRRFDLARRSLAADPTSLDAIDAATEELGSRGRLVRQAAWTWQSVCLEPSDGARLARAADQTWVVKWPKHGIAANKALLLRSPDDIDLIARICHLYGVSKNRSAALAWGQSLLASDPAHMRIWNLVATMYKDVEAVEECSTLWSRIVRRYPESHQLRYNYALFLDEQDRLSEATRQLRISLIVAPGYARASNQLSLVSNRSHLLGRALKEVAWTIATNPTSPNGHMNKGMYLRIVGEYGKAIIAFSEAERLAPPGSHQAAAARYNTAMAKVNIGELGEGFKLAESRWALDGFPSSKRNFRQRIWPGPDRARNATLLLFLEQGLGDEMLLSWYVPLVRRDVSRLVVDCDARLIDTFSRTYEGVEFIPKSVAGDPKTHDPQLRYKIPSFHVPQYYVSELKNLIHENWDWALRQGTRFPSRLTLDPVRVERWRNWLDHHRAGRPAVGVCWRSGHLNRYRNPHYMSIEEVATCLPAGTLVVNLQYSSTDDELASFEQLAGTYGFDFISPEGVDLKNDLDDVMALLLNVDVTVSATTAVAWMAGAVGCPTYMYWTSDERRFWPKLGTPFIPWAPSIRVFRRDPSEDWTPTIADLRSSLVGLLSDAGARTG